MSEIINKIGICYVLAPPVFFNFEHLNLKSKCKKLLSKLYHKILL